MSTVCHILGRIRLVLLVCLLLATSLLCYWNKTNDPRFLAFVETSPGQFLADLFGWWRSPLERPFEEKRLSSLTTQEQAVRQNLERSHSDIRYKDIVIQQRFPELDLHAFPHVRVWTDQPEPLARRMAGVLAEVHQNIVSTFAPLLTRPAQTRDVHLLYFDEVSQFRLSLPKLTVRTDNITGFYNPWMDLLAIAGEQTAGTRAADDAFFTLRHEAAHQVFYSNGLHSPYRQEPEWLVEGLASYCETTPFGAVNPTRVTLLKQLARNGAVSSLSDVLNRSGDQRVVAHRSEADSEQAYCEAWGLVHFLMKPEYRARFFEFVLRLERRDASFRAATNDPRRLLGQALGLNPEELDAAWTRHLASL